MYRLGVDIGGTKVNIGLVDENKSIAYKKAFNIPNKDFTAVMHLIKTSLESILNENNIEKNSIISCGMGIPGTVSENGKTAVKVPNLNWENAPCAEVFEKFTGIPTTLVQDSRAAALGEYLAAAQKAFEGVIDSLYEDENGRLTLDEVCTGTCIEDGDYAHYINRPKVKNDMHGTGAFLQMCAELNLCS